MKNSKEIWVIIETRQGIPAKHTSELFTPARDIAEKIGGSVAAVVLGSDNAQAETLAVQLGADRVISAEHPSLEFYSAAAYTDVLHGLAKKYGPEAIMISANRNGRDFASMLAARLKTGITANTTAVDVDTETGIISWMMPAPGGIMATILCRKTLPQMGTICPGVFKAPELDPTRTAPVIHEEVTPVQGSVEVMERSIDDKTGEVSIADAEIVVSGGRGMGSAENFELVHKLAEALGGVVGASRAAVDLEWADESRLVGQTGKVIHPKLYIACGISGALQHMVGVKADMLVAINSDPEAAIFDYADIGIIGDAVKIIPEIIEQL